MVGLGGGGRVARGSSGNPTKWIRHQGPEQRNCGLDGPSVGPFDPSTNYQLAQNPHLGGINCLLGDASVRTVSRSISAQTWAKACDPRDGQPLGNDW